jgi:hypothetical protein
VARREWGKVVVGELLLYSGHDDDVPHTQGVAVMLL